MQREILDEVYSSFKGRCGLAFYVNTWEEVKITSTKKYPIVFHVSSRFSYVLCIKLLESSD